MPNLLTHVMIEGAGLVARAQGRRQRAMLDYSGTPGPIAFEGAAGVAALIATLLASWPRRQGTSTDPVITVAGRGRGFEIASRWLETPVPARSAVEAACGTLVELAKAYLDEHPDLLCLHCAAFEVGGRLVAITGTNHAGKSTLAARLCCEGMRFYCDDMLPLRHDGHGIALGMPPRLRLPIPATAGMRLRTYLARNLGPQDGHYGYVLAPERIAHGASAPLGAMIVLDRRDGGTAGFAPIGRSEALQHLLRRNLRRDGDIPTMFDKLAALSQELACTRLVYSDLDEAGELIARRFAQWPPSALLPRQDGALVADVTPVPDAAMSALPADQPMRRRGDIGMRGLDGDIFLVDGGEQAVLHLNLLGAAVWNLLETPISRAAVLGLLVEAFPTTDRASIGRDLDGLFGDLMRHGLIEATH